MKKSFLIIAFIAFSFAGNAQVAGIRGFKFGGGIEVAIPVSNLTGVSIGAGADLLAHYGISDQVALTADVGYVGLFVKGTGSNTINIIPIRGGLRFYATPNIYLSGRAGVGILTGGGSSVTTTAYAFGGGYRIDDKLDIGAAYEGYSKNGSFGYIGIRLGYFFN